MSTEPGPAESHRVDGGHHDVAAYDLRQRHARDRGRLKVDRLLSHGITRGRVLEIGPGPGYLGLEWLKHTDGTTSIGLEANPQMAAVAGRNASEYSLSERARYVHGTGSRMPFASATFDGCFARNSLHEWSQPRATFDEMWRVLKPGGVLLMSDPRRDVFPPLRWLVRLYFRLRGCRSGRLSSVERVYTLAEVKDLIKGTALEGCSVRGSRIGVWVWGTR